MGTKSRAVIRKQRGRPATGQDPVTALRLPPALRFGIESWAKQQHDKPTRSEAIRRLIEFALGVQATNQSQVPMLDGPNLGQNRNMDMSFLPIQCRMARSALGLGVRDLAATAKVSADTVARFERGDELKERTIEALQRALESAGVEFINGDQPGVRLRKGGLARPGSWRR